MREADEAVDLYEEIRAILAGRRPEVVGATLGDLLATWLASHVVLDSPTETDALRERLLAMHTDAVRALLPFYHNQIHAGGDDTP